MKRLIICLIAVLSLNACQEKKHGPFVIAGKISNSNSGKVLLEELPFGGENPVVLDSATLQKSGTFELRALGKEEGIYAISFENGPEVLIINDTKNIKLRLDANNYKSYTTENSPASTSLHQFLETYSTQFGNVATAFTLADSLEKTNASDSSITVANLQKQELLKTLNTYITNFINTASSPALCYYALGKSFEHILSDLNLKEQTINEDLSTFINNMLFYDKNISNIEGMERREILCNKQYDFMFNN